MGVIEAHLFARAPVAGRTKTRLARHVGDERAVAIHRAFVEDVATMLASLPYVSLVLSVTEPHTFFDTIAARVGATVELQSEGDLGARMASALSRGIERTGGALVVGSDAPTLPRALVAQAVRALSGASAVFAPAADGGYVLVGAREVPSFANVRWSTRHALADTVAANPGRTIAFVEPWFDVDERADLELLAAQLRLSRDAAPSTHRLLVDERF